MSGRVEFFIDGNVYKGDWDYKGYVAESKSENGEGCLSALKNRTSKTDESACDGARENIEKTYHSAQKGDNDKSTLLNKHQQVENANIESVELPITGTPDELYEYIIIPDLSTQQTTAGICDEAQISEPDLDTQQNDDFEDEKTAK